MRIAPLLLLLAVAAGCSSSSTSPGATSTLTISSLDADDGSFSGTLTAGKLLVCCGVNGGIYVGQANISGSFATFTPGISRGFVRFSLAMLPVGATVVSATFKLTQVSAGFSAGPDPYPTLGNVVIEHPDFGTVIDTADFARVALSNQRVTLASDYTPNAKTADVTTFVADDAVAGRGHTDLRLRFVTETLPATSTGGLGTFFGETSGIISGAGPIPQLVIVYR